MAVRTLVFVPGWGFDANFWMPVAEHLPEFARVFIDFGFYGAPPQMPKVPGALVVAHSMGFPWALANMPRPWVGAVAVNGFPRFTRSSDFVSGVAPRTIERMLTRFPQAPAEVLTQFLSRCGVESPRIEGFSSERLGEMLTWLAECDERANLATLDCPILALAGTRDPLVSKAMSVASFAAHALVLAEGGGHLLPQEFPEWVAGQIRQFSVSLA